MKIITCFKLVPEEQDITVTPEHSLNFDRAEAKISQFDLNAIEAAAQLADALFMVQDAQLEHALPKETALALASAAEKIGFDLLLFGEGSGDIYAQQVGLLTGELLKLPVINAVSHIQRDGDKIIVERTLEEDVEIIELTLPAVLCVTSDINVPRIPSMKAILGAGKKAVTSWLASDIHWTPTTPMAELVAISVPPQTERKHIILDNDSPEAITALADHLKKSLN